MPEVSIMVSARDSFSPSIKNMTNNIKGFSKEAEEAANKVQNLEKKEESLCDRQAKLRVNMDEIKSSLLEARKEFKLTGDEVSRINLENAYKGFEKLSGEMNTCKREIRDTDRAIRELNGTQSKNSNRASAEKSMFAALASVGFTKMAGDVLAQGANFYVGSAYGSDAGTIFGSTLSGAAAGAAMGMPLGPAGAAAGGIIGGVTGLVSGELNVAQRQDDAFKSAVQNLYDSLTQENVAMVESGINIAAVREMDKIAFGKLYGNDIVGAAQQDWAIGTANETPFLYEDIKAISKTLATYGYSSQDTRKTVMQIGDTGAALGMSTQDMSMVATGLGRMQSTGKTTMEYMNLLIERGIPASEYLAEAYSKTQGEIAEMVSKGLIPGAEAAKIIADSMGEVNAGAMEQMSKTFTGLSSTLEGWEQEFQNAAGAGYLEIRTPAQEEQVEHYDMMGNKYEEAAGVSGKLMAVQENRRERIFRDKMKAMFEGTDESGYTEALVAVRQAEIDLDEAENFGIQNTINAREDALAVALTNLQSIVDTVEAQADIEYMGSDMEKSMQNASMGLIKDIKGFLKDGDTWKAWGYNIGIEMGKGMMSVQPENAMVPTKTSSTHSDAWGMDYSSPKDENQPGTPQSTHGSAWGMDYLPAKQAFGMNYVPYDNFPALLHQGERVLTASEARAASTTTPTINITGNNFTVREEADVDRIAAELLRNLQKARFTYAP